MYTNPDFHMHSTFSDGTDTPSMLLENIKRADIDIFALTDHDTFDGCLELRKYLKEGDPLFVNGIELSCEDDIGKYHVLGYAFDTNKDSIKNACQITQSARKEKAYNRFKYLEEEYGFTFSDEDKNWLNSLENPGKPHFVQLMLKNGYVDDKEYGFKILKGYKGVERRLTPTEAIDAILFSDGIPVLAHGILGDGGQKLTIDEITERVERLKKVGLMGLECYYSTYTPEQVEIMLSLAKKYNLFVTAGSDYHGTGKTVRLGETNNPDPKIMNRFFRTVEMFND